MTTNWRRELPRFLLLGAIIAVAGLVILAVPLFAAATILVVYRIVHSSFGRTLIAIREDETAAASMGINTVNTKLLAFALGASFSGFVGAFVGAYQTAIFPESFSFSVSISISIQAQSFPLRRTLSRIDIVIE